MARNQESINMVASLLVVSAGKHKGKTVPEIQEACPSLSRQAIQRILKKPGFKRVINAAAYPPQYWFDVTESDPFRVAEARNDNPRMSEIQADSYKYVKETPFPFAKTWRLVNRLTGADILEIRKRIDAAIHSDEIPNPQVKKDIEDLAKFYCRFVARLENLMADPLWDTPEWWRLLKEDES